MPLFHSFLWLSNVPFCICTTSSLASVYGHLGYFHDYMAIVYNVTVNIGVYVSFQVMVCFPDRYAGVGLLDHVVILFLVF